MSYYDSDEFREELLYDLNSEDPYAGDWWCCECGKPCEVVEEDYGIGQYEYWGAVGYHTNIISVSKCCEADYQDFAPVGDDDEPNLDHIPASQVVG